MFKWLLSILGIVTDWYCTHCNVDYSCEIPTSAIGVLCDKLHIGVSIAVRLKYLIAFKLSNILSWKLFLTFSIHKRRCMHFIVLWFTGKHNIISIILYDNALIEQSFDTFVTVLLWSIRVICLYSCTIAAHCV